MDARLVGSDSDIDPSTADAALCFHAWYRAICLIAQKVAAVPKYVLRTVGNPPYDGKERATDHPVYPLVSDRANEEQTAFQFWLQMAGHVASRGNGYAVIFRVGSRATEFIPMDPDRTYPVRMNGQLWYLTYPYGHHGDGIRVQPSDVLHFKGFGGDGLVGYPVWKKATEEIGLGRGERKLESSRYKQGARPGMILQTDARLDDKARSRIREDWERMHQGVNNSWRTALLDNGLKATPVSFSPEDLQQDKAAQMSIVAISNFTGVPVSKLGGGGRSYASQEQEDQAFVNDGLDFYFNVFEDEAAAKLLTDQERSQGYEVKANREALLRPAIIDKFNVLRVATAGKPFMTQNEARKRIDMPPADEEGADILGTPLNMGQGGIANQPADNADPQPGRPTNPDESAAVMAAAEKGILHAAEKMIKRVAFQANRAAKDGAKFMAFLETIRAEHLSIFRQEFEAVEAIAQAATGLTVPLNHAIADSLLIAIEEDFTAISGTASARTLEASVAKAIAAQAVELPKRLVRMFLFKG